ncbi:LlaJI family restriction endonuclease [bacterium]|nr:LlaJI family restriction endonuclease [bacterium]
MTSRFLKEQKRYTKLDLINHFNLGENKSISLIKKLKEYNILKMVKQTAEQKDLSDLVDTDIEIADVESNNSQYYYVPTFVGIIIVNNFVLKIYPKYFLNDDKNDSKDKAEIDSKFKTVIKVLEKYNKSKEQIVKITNNTAEKSFFNLLALELFLIKDYLENGTYRNSRNITEINGSGEILWEKTVNETYAIISRSKPYYTELETIKTINDNSDFIKRLYECVLTTISKNIEENDLLELFDIPKLELSEEKLTNFGDKEYVLYKIEQELRVEFNTRKQMILKLLYAYIAKQSYSNTVGYNISMFGTNNFNLVWEDVCKKVLNNMLDTKLKNLPIVLESKYQADQYNDKTLKLIIDKPLWSEAIDTKNIETFEPDLVTIKDDKFIILDAKYYCPKFENNQITRQPGIESITKQYMYQLSFKSFIEEHNLCVKNCFLYPSDDISDFNKNKYSFDKGNVKLEILDSLNVDLLPIENKFLQASIMYDYYLNNQTNFDFNKISL